MTVWVFETNLMWSSKLKQSLRMLGHEALVLRDLPEEGSADVAIVNLSEKSPEPGTLIAALSERGIPSIAHAGHKEKELHEIGREAGASRLATNSEMAWKLPELLASVQKP